MQFNHEMIIRQKGLVKLLLKVFSLFISTLEQLKLHHSLSFVWMESPSCGLVPLVKHASTGMLVTRIIVIRDSNP